MLTRLVVKNFKSIGPEGIDIELKPLTIFVGPNGGGKSSILEALAFLAEAWHTQYGGRPRPPVWPNSHPSFWPTLIHQQEKDTPAEIRVQFASSPDFEWVCKIVTRDRGEAVAAFDPSAGRESKAPNAATARLVHDTRILRALRGQVPYETSANENPDWVGSQGEALVPLHAQLGAAKHKKKREKIEYWADHFGLREVGGHSLGEGKLATDYFDDKLGVALNLALASTGSRQILTVITQLFWSKPGSLIMIEEPEISLHPESQVKLAEMFAEAVKEQKQLLITTHSSFLLLALSQPIKAGTLSADQVAVYDVTKTSQGTQAKRLPLTKEGYIKGWVPSFAKVEGKLLQKWVKSLPKAAKVRA